MHKVLIVDDDPAIREGLPLLIDWESHGFRVAGTAENGLRALELLKIQPCGLVITDVRMPTMDGLTLADRLSSLLPSPQVVILSAFGDFSYAQRAIRHGARRYLLKPVDARMLGETLDELKPLLDEQRRRESELAGARLASERQELRSLLEGDSDSAPPPAGEDWWFQPVLIRGSHDASRETAAAAQRILSPGSPFCLAAPLAEGTAVLLGDGEKPPEVTLSRLEELLRTLEAEGRPFTGIVMGDFAKGLQELPRAYRQAVALLENYAFEGSRVVYADSPHLSEVLQPILSHIRQHCAEKLSLRSISAGFYINPSYLGRIFKRYTGLSFNDYLADCRIELARRLLDGTTRSVTDIAESVGYSDTNYFCRLFKSKTDYTPSEYRSRLRGGPDSPGHK